MINYSHHALDKFSQRACVDPTQAMEILDREIHTGLFVTLEEATKMKFNITRIERGDRYVVFSNDKMHLLMCGILRQDNTLVTVLTQELYSRPRNDMKFRRNYIEAKGIEI